MGTPSAYLGGACSAGRLRALRHKGHRLANVQRTACTAQVLLRPKLTGVPQIFT